MSYSQYKTRKLNLEFEGLCADTVLHLQSPLPFGKYKGQVVSETIVEDPDYMHWFETNVTGFQLSKEAHNALDETPNLSEEVYDEDKDIFWGVY